MYALTGGNITYQNFHPSEPNDPPFNPQDCVSMTYFANKWSWYTSNCGDQTPYYICQKDPYLLTS